MSLSMIYHLGRRRCPAFSHRVLIYCCLCSLPSMIRLRIPSTESHDLSLLLMKVQNNANRAIYLSPTKSKLLYPLKTPDPRSPVSI